MRVELQGARSPSPALGVLWGKSDAGGKVCLLGQHLLDAAAVAELIWDQFFAPALRSRIDSVCGGRGRVFLALLCGLHDVGKASPAFQEKVPELAARVRAAGLRVREFDGRPSTWHHTVAGAVIVRRVLREHGWAPESVGWVWPLVAGHHGKVPGADKLRPPRRDDPQGSGLWVTVQDEVVRWVASELGVDLDDVVPVGVPRRADQLAMSGAIIMADWIASDGKHFGGVDSLRDVSMAKARDRAGNAWLRLGLRGGWNPSRLVVHGDPVRERFGVTARAAQADVVALAGAMPSAGLLLLEAPMGEGKTEAALAAVEVLARRFGADGVFLGMPTQATCDPMFTRVRRWAGSVERDVPVGLLHGRRRFNREWHDLFHERRVCFDGIDEFGCADGYGTTSPEAVDKAGDAPAEWFLGAKRGLLMPVVVGTIDHLLHAATRTRHVMLRHTGVAGRVVVLDEVHAYDVYMAQFLFEALRWLGDGGVPVVLLSATLPPSMRTELVRAYVQGALLCRDVDVCLPDVDGYPRAMSVCVDGGAVRCDARSASPWRPPVPVRVEIVDEAPEDGRQTVVALLAEALAQGGCALVVRNTVGRAQRTYAALREVFGGDVVLLHARLAMGERVERTERILDLLGPPGRTDARPRPQRLVVVATQLAEQSFDADVDLVVSDLAPIDLLLQRVGRLHRHERPAGARPPRVAVPRVVVTGMARRAAAPPAFPRGSSYVYGDHLLLRAAHLVIEAADGPGWTIPAQVPELVARGYADTQALPEEWASAAEAAHRAWLDDRRRRQADAEQFLLAGPDELGQPTLAGLHDRSTADLPTDEAVVAVVRDGTPSVDVVLVRRGDRDYLSLDGRSIGVTGEAVSDEEVLERVAAGTVRLPARPELTAAVERELRPLPGWTGDPWLSRTRALVLDEDMSARLGGRLLTYDHDLGLIDDRQVQR